MSQDDDYDGKRNLYTELNSSLRPQSILREHECPSSKSSLTLPLESKNRPRKFRHKRSKSHENYAKIVSPRHSPHVEKV